MAKWSKGRATLGNDCDFPIIEETANDKLYRTEAGNIYKWREDLDCWKQVECYLASVPTQYGCKTYEEQFTKLINQLGDRLHPERYSKGKRDCILIDGKLVNKDAISLREKHYNATQTL